MTFDDNQFSVVLDKGTFDALMSNRSQQVRQDEENLLSSFVCSFFYQTPGPFRYQSNARSNRSCSSTHRSFYMHHTRTKTYSATYLTIFFRQKVCVISLFQRMISWK